MKEPTARIKINWLLVALGWRLFANPKGLAGIHRRPVVTLTEQSFDT